MSYIPQINIIIYSLLSANYVSMDSKSSYSSIVNEDNNRTILDTIQPIFQPKQNYAQHADSEYIIQSINQ